MEKNITRRCTVSLGVLPAVAVPQSNPAGLNLPGAGWPLPGQTWEMAIEWVSRFMEKWWYDWAIEYD